MFKENNNYKIFEVGVLCIIEFWDFKNVDG